MKTTTTTMKTTTPTRFGTGPRQLGLSAALALFTLSVLPASAASVALTATGDNTMLNGGLANDNYGNFNPISAGAINGGIPNQISVLRFNVSALDGLYSSIDSVTLRLYYADDSSSGAGTAMVTTNVHAISAANRAWGEGTHAGGAATGESTWNNLAHNSTPWAGSAGLGTAGTDYDSTALATYTIDLSNRPAAGTVIDFTFTGTSAALTALIDTWMVDNVDNSQDNPGLLLRDPAPNPSARNRFTASSTEAAAELHPQLIVNYTVVPEPSSVLLLGLGGLAMFRRCRG